MRKGRDGGKKTETGKRKGEKTDDYSGPYVIASSRPPERQLLERRTLVPINTVLMIDLYILSLVMVNYTYAFATVRPF